MAKLISASINVTKIDKTKLIDGKTGKWLPLSISLKDEADQYGNNCSISIGQSKEEREAKTEIIYLGNGKVVWEGDQKSTQKKQTEVEEGDLPW